ncbi:hypothetical protein [Mesorhizobium sp.]|uniref:hypothetical protein n=1 Tax=Mesorhizobium sp. TaxID=1871066 RepID=UPI0025F4CBB5|nr:hypothetical protein [Mesorhizobium sp.]
MARMVALLRLILWLACCAAITSCGQDVPPLLQGVSARGGWYGGCPRPASASKEKPALSPELDQRLRVQFPPGTPASKLSTTLVNQGFTIGSPCKEDTSIKVANYIQKEDGILLLTRTESSVFWKVHEQENIVWTQGFVMFIGL